MESITLTEKCAMIDFGRFVKINEIVLEITVQASEPLGTYMTQQTSERFPFGWAQLNGYRLDTKNDGKYFSLSVTVENLGDVIDWDSPFI